MRLGWTRAGLVDRERNDAFEIYFGDENGWTYDWVGHGCKWSLEQKSLFPQNPLMDAPKHL